MKKRKDSLLSRVVYWALCFNAFTAAIYYGWLGILKLIAWLGGK